MSEGKSDDLFYFSRTLLEIVTGKIEYDKNADADKIVKNVQSIENLDKSVKEFLVYCLKMKDVTLEKLKDHDFIRDKQFWAIFEQHQKELGSYKPEFKGCEMMLKTKFAHGLVAYWYKYGVEKRQHVKNPNLHSYSKHVG